MTAASAPRARVLARVLLCAAALAAALLIQAPDLDGASHPPTRSALGVVAADNAVASQVGAEILAAGGNAVDAGVGVAAALGLIHPFASGVGGGGFCLHRDADTGAVIAYDFREMAPAAASHDMYLDADGEPQPELSVRGGLAVGVPGEVAGMAHILAAHGRRSLAQNLAPVIALARHGYPASTKLEDRVARKLDALRDDPGLSAWLLPEGRAPIAGEVLRNPALADTLEAIAAGGPAAFYEGPRAEAIVEAVRARGGVMTLDDLAGYRVHERAPMRGAYRGHEIYSMPPPSSGGIALIEALNILEGFDLASMGHNSSQALHHLTEALKFVFADRAQFLGDPDFVEIPVERLIDPDMARELRDKIDPDATLPRDAYGPDFHVGDDAGTSHFSIIDRDGGMLACTTTVNTSFGSLVYAADVGVLLNNQMDDFVQKPGAPNTYGLIGSEANAVAPGKRPLSSMSPTLILRDGEPFMAVGASGGPAIISSTLQAIVNVIDFGLDAREAVEAPRVHHQWVPEVLFIEPEAPVDVRANLEARGHALNVRSAWSAVQIVIAGDPWKTAASDPRKHGAPAAEPAAPSPALPAPTLPPQSPAPTAPTPTPTPRPTLPSPPL